MDITRYIVKVNGCNMPHNCRSEHGAIKIAQTYLDEANPENVSVIRQVISGSYVSKTQAWPMVGDTYTN